MGLGRRIGSLAVVVTIMTVMGGALPGRADPQEGDDAAALQRALESSITRGCLTPRLRDFYAARGYQPIWWGKRAPNESANQLVTALRQSADDGLEATSYEPDELERQLRDARPGLFRHGWSPEQRAQLELELSSTLVTLATDLHDGRVDPSAVEWGIRPDPWEPENVLAQVAQEHDVARALEAVRPRNPGYTRLREALKQLRQQEANGGWPTVDSGRVLHEGDRDDRVLQLRARLRAWGELSPEVTASDERLDDGQVADAVRAFQQHHGLQVDGVVGEETLRELSVPVSDRIDQIQLNLERWRWMPSNPGERFVLVNAASFELDAYEDGRPALHSPIVVGLPDPEWQTPVLEDSIDDVDVHPDWHVPMKIEREELIPVLQQEPDAFEPLGMRVFDRHSGEEVDPFSITWTEDSANDYELVQDAGPINPLGNTRLLMHDALGIYLHGTPVTSVFQFPERDLSHGCIRVEAISQLTEWALSDPALITSYRDDVAGNVQTRLNVPQPVPVYVTYFTAFVGDDGAVNFRPDLYERDLLLQRGIDQALALRTARTAQRCSRTS